jgi:hypothetical protein
VATVHITRPLADEALERIAASAEMRVRGDPDIPPSREILLAEMEDVDGLGCLLTDSVDEAVISAGLDVLDPKRTAMDDPLFDPDNAILLRHIASASVATRTKMATMAADNLIAGLRGQRPPNLVNPEVLSS